MKYCFNCGGKIIGSNPKFCSECGTELIGGETFNLEKEINLNVSETDFKQPKEVFKPKFKFSYRLLMSTFNSSSLFFIFFFSMAFGSMVKEFSEGVNSEFTVSYLPSFVHGQYVYYAIFLLFLVAVFMGIVPIFSLLFKWLSYRKTEYRIYSDRIEYREGFMTENYSKIDFEKVIEVHLKKGFIQKQFGLGTVFLEIPASGKARNGINMTDLEDSDKVYELMRGMIK
jgi:membrane protein YdbS with pleckstrin-like domain